MTGSAQLSRVHGEETWRVYEVLDESLAPSGPVSLHDLAGSYLAPGSRVLDAGCRDAAHLIRLIREVFVGVMEDLPFPDGHFGFVWCRDVIEQVDDLDSALREVRRVLSGTGRMLVYTTFVTHRFTDQEAEMMNRPLGNVPSNLVEANVERSFARGGWAIDDKTVVGTEWRGQR